MHTLFNAWNWRMAWRDSRRHRRRLALFMSSMILGVAALVAVSSFENSLEKTLQNESRSLLGADLAVEKDHQPFSTNARALLDSLGGRQAREISFASMAQFPKNQGTRLVQVRALQGDYPFYGRFITQPAAAAGTFQNKRQAIVDNNLMAQYNIQVGDSVRIGQVSYAIAGRLKEISTENAATSMLAPRIFVPLAQIDTTLLQHGSRAEYRTYLAFDSPRNVEGLVEELHNKLPDESIDTDTVAEEQNQWADALGNMSSFLNLVAFIALLLGGIGIGSAVHVYVKQKLQTVAILRCVGARTRQTFAIYLIQAGAMGLTAALLGALLGSGLQFFLPRLMSPYLPVEVTFSLSWMAIGEGLFVGLTTALLFALIPLLSIRKVSPLSALRAAYQSTGQRRDPWQWAIGLVIVLAITGFAILQTGSLATGSAFAGGVILVFALLTGTAHGLTYLIKHYFPSSWAYIWRQGLANLYRPFNQTTILMLSLGLGSFLVMTLFITQKTLLQEVTSADDKNRPNLVLFDIQNHQKAPVTKIVQDLDIPVLQQVPIVPMKIEAVNGQPVDSIKNDPKAEARGWALSREYRSTYRDHLSRTETIKAGQWQGTAATGQNPVPVSLAENITEDLDVWLGDQLTFDVQGKSVQAVVASVRSINWRRMQPNFFVVFPKGVLEKAPQTHVLVARAPSTDLSAQTQQKVVARFPNISAIDLSLVIQTVDRLVSHQAFVIRFMALFSIVTGLIILTAAISNNRYQRVQESVLLKTLGASKKQIISIMVVEYLFLGGLAALTGVMLAYAAAWGLATYLFEVNLAPAWGVMGLAVVGITGLTLLIGWLNSRGTYSYPPAEILRMNT